MKLGEWRRYRGMTQAELAEQLQCSLTAVARYEAGVRIPQSATMVDIFTLTRGAVEPNDFYALPSPAVLLRVPQLDAAQ